MASSNNRPPHWGECVISHSIDGDYRDRREYLRLVRIKYRRHLKVDGLRAARIYMLREIGYWVFIVWPLRIIKWAWITQKIAR